MSYINRTDRFTDDAGRNSAITSTRLEDGRYRAIVTEGHGYGMVGYASTLLSAIAAVSVIIDTLDEED